MRRVALTGPSSKGAVKMFSPGLSGEVASRGITVNNVQPGPIDTELDPAAGDWAVPPEGRHRALTGASSWSARRASTSASSLLEIHGSEASARVQKWTGRRRGSGVRIDP